VEFSNKPIVFDKIPFELDQAKILEQMHVHGNPQRYEASIREMIEAVKPIARPKAMFKVCCVDKKDHDSLEIDGVRFTSRLIRTNLDPVESVFVCSTTAGTELETIEQPQDVLKRFCLDAIKNTVMFYATDYLKKYLIRHYSLKQLSNLNPGETESFPIDQQRKIFQILGDVEGMIGVRLTENCALVPTKSHTGIYYSTETEFISCRLCTNQRCMGRRAPYDPELAKQYK